MFGTDKYLLHAEISPVALAEVAEEYQRYFGAKVETVSAKQAQIGGDMQMAESSSRHMFAELNALKKEAAVASAGLSTDGPYRASHIASVPPLPPQLQKEESRSGQLHEMTATAHTMGGCLLRGGGAAQSRR